MNTTKYLGNIPIATILTAGLIAFCNNAFAEKIKRVDDLKPSYRPALNYPQAVAWSNKRNAESIYALRASDVIGRSVFNGVGTELGEVDDLIVLNRDSGQVMQLVVEAGGFLGLGERLVAVLFSEFKIDPDNDDVVYLNITEAQLKSLPEFKYSDGEKSGKAIYSKPESGSQR